MALSNDFPSSYDLSLTEVPSGVRALFVHDHPPTKNTLRVTLTVLQKFYLNWNLQNPKGVQELQKLHRVGKYFNGWRPDPPPPPTPQKRKY